MSQSCARAPSNDAAHSMRNASSGSHLLWFNPSNYLAEKGYPFLKKLLYKTELLVLNKEEATLLCGKLEIAGLINRLTELGPKIAVITDGKNGAYVNDKKKILHVMTSGIKPKETTGAGDAFASTFLAGIIMKKDFSECMKMGCANSVSVISNIGAKTGLLKLNKVKEKLMGKNIRVEILNKKV